jgi:hypothetical protein
MSQEGFIALNPQLTNGVEIGLLKVPLKLFKRGQKEYIALSKKNQSGNQKKMVLLCRLISR